MEAFPQVQFIASTHSPIPLLGVGRNESFILNVSRSVETGIIVTHNDIEVHRLNPNALLTSPIFGLQNLGAVDTDEAEAAPIENYNELERTNLIKKRLQRLRQQGVIP
jgi:predicted ATP-binding protein involved in virulence